MNVFEITIQRRAGDQAPVVVEYRQSGGLPVRNEGRLELTEEVLNAQVTPLDYGRVLGKALFRDDVRDAFARALAQAGERLHVLLFVEDETLTAWHWERLAAPLDGDWDFLSLNQRTPFSLYLPSVTDRRFPPIGRRDLRALIIAASPGDLEQRFGLKQFDVASAVAGVRAGLGDIRHTVLADASQVPDAAGPPTLDALVAHITAEPITLLQVVCHGQVSDEGETVIYLADAQNRVVAVPTSQLIERLRRIQGALGLPHFAFLSTCESAPPEAEGALGGLGQRLVRDLGMPAVVAMTDRVTVQTANDLAAAFYPRLREHGQPDLALAEAGAALAGRHDITVPALYSRLGGLPLFSDALDRELTSAEIEYGLARLEGLLPVRAPVLLEPFREEADTLRRLLAANAAALSAETQAERAQALAEINSLSLEVLDLSFNALALGQEPPAYDERCPFQGLRAFSYEQRAFFFGREQLSARLSERLAGHNFLAVLGASGSGKSSLVMAGLIPALERQYPGLHWSVVKPGDEIPEPAIENPQSLLVVDQFEELFTQISDAAQRQTIVDRMLAVAQGRRVLLTMRADFWGECAFHPALRAEMQAHQELIPPMEPAELRSTMEQQAQSVGLRFEADLANIILDDVAGEPGAMPLLQHALLELWKRRHGRWMRAEEYRNLGAVRQAIAHTADGIYDQAPAADKRRIRDIFLRLTRLDEDAAATERRDTRRRVPFLDLVPAGADLEPTRLLVQELADARLVVTSVNAASSQEEVEVAHEALIRYWERLQGWLDEDRDILRLRQNLNQDAHQWQAANRDEALLPRWSARLEDVRVLERRGDLTLSSLEQGYLEATEALRDREAAEKEAQRQRELEQAQKLAEEQSLRAEEGERAASSLRKRLILATVAVGIAVMAFAAATWLGVDASKQRNTAQTASTAAVDERNKAAIAAVTATVAQGQAEIEARNAVEAKKTAEANAAEAKRQALISRSRQLAAQSSAESSNNRQEPAILLAIESGVATDTQEAVSAIRSAIALPGRNTKVFFGHTGPVTQATWSRDESKILTSSDDGTDDGTARIWDAGSGDELVQLAGHTGGVNQATWSQDESKILTHSDDGTARIWDAGSGDELVKLVGHTKGVNQATWNQDESKILTSGYDYTVRIWDASSGDELVKLAGHEGYLFQATWNLDETKILTSGQDNTARIWDAGSGDELVKLAGHAGYVYQATWSQDESKILTHSGDGTARIWDASSGDELVKLEGDTGGVTQATWNQDESKILTSADDGTARIWDAGSGDELVKLAGHTGDVNQATWSRDESKILTHSDDGTARIWDAGSGDELVKLVGHTGGVTQATWSQDESKILTRSDDDGTARIWDAGSGDELVQLVGHTGYVYQATWSRDESKVLTSGYDGTARIWDVASGAELVTLADVTDVLQATWNQDGSKILTSGDDGTARIWDAGSGDELVQLAGHTWAVNQATWSRDESKVLTISSDDTTRIWDAGSGDELVQLVGHTEDVYQATWSRDESKVLTSGDDATARIWDAGSGDELVQLVGHTGDVTQATWSQDESKILTRSRNDNTARIWDAGSGDELVKLVGHTGGVTQATWNQDETKILTSSFDDTARIWDAGSGDELVQLAGHTNFVNQATWSQDESKILTSSVDGTARIWDAGSGDELVKLAGHTGDVNQATWSQDESKILTRSDDDGTARIWDAGSGDELVKLVGHTGGVTQATWNQDESKILTRSADDGTARIWDAGSGAELMKLEGDTGDVIQATWSQDKSKILIGSEDGTVRIWYTRMPDLVSAACSRASRNLSWDEWNRFMRGSYRPTCAEAPIPPDVIEAIQGQATAQVQAGELDTAGATLAQLNGWLAKNGQLKSYGVDPEAFIAGALKATAPE